MNPIVMLMNLWTLIKSVPWLYKRLLNWRDVKVIIEKAYALVESARVSGGLPNCSSFDSFLDAVEVVLKKGLVDIPEVDENVLADELHQMRQLLTCSISNERQKRGLE